MKAARVFFLLIALTAIVYYVLFPGASSSSAQSTNPVSSPSAVALANKALQALAGNTPLTDITLQANVSLVLGSDEETGTATLVARGDAQSLVTLNLSGGQRQEVRNGVAGVSVGADGTPQAMANHNCFIDADWFFPALSLQALANDPTLVISLVGQEVRGGEQVYHLTLFHTISSQIANVVATVRRVSTMDVYLDATSLLPVALDFNMHPDQDADTNLPAEILFGSYQSFNGVQAPTRIQKYVNNSLVLDLTVTNAAVNSGVSPSVFTLPIVDTGGGQ